MEMLLGMAAVVIVLGHLALGLILWLRVRKLYSYPGLLGFPVIGNLYYFYKSLFFLTGDSLLNQLVSVAENYGESGICFHVTYGYKITAIITSPDLLKELSFHPNLGDKPHDIYGGFLDYMNGPFTKLTADGIWKQQRKAYNTFLKRSCVDKDYYSKMIKSADKLVDMMLESSTCDSRPICLALAHSVSLSALSGIETNLTYDPDVVHKLERIIDLGSVLGANSNIMRTIAPLIRPMVDLALGKAVELRKVILEKISNTLLLKTEPFSEPSLLLKLAERCIEYNENEQQLIREIQELYLTSSHTVSSALSNTIIILALQSGMQERAWQEQCEIFGHDNRDPTIEDLEQMQFLERFLKECLRFVHPPFAGRKASDDIHIHGITIPRGTVLYYLYHHIKMNPKYWKNPKVFDPDRFLEDSNLTNYTYNAFGVGIRNCPGMYFATTLMKITLSKILRRLKVRPAKDFRFEDIKYRAGLLMEMDTYPLLQVEERT